MKTSFYIVIWFLLCLFLRLFDNSFIHDYAFIVALAIVWGLSLLLNHVMSDTLEYERVLQNSPILEDVYTGNVSSFRKRLIGDCCIETAIAICFFATFVIALDIFKPGENNGGNNWIAVAICGFFAYRAISRSVPLIRATAVLISKPTPEQCMKIADKTYKLDYASYSDARNGASYQDMLSSEPEDFKVYNTFSMVIAAMVALPGLFWIVFCILYTILCIIICIMMKTLDGELIDSTRMIIIYSSLISLPACIGVKDFVSCIRAKSNTKAISKVQTA